MVKEKRFRTTLAFALGALIVQFLLGMAVNLFVKVPADHPGANPPEYFGGVLTSVTWAILNGGLWLTLHSLWGLVLLLAALGTLVQAVRLRGGGADHAGGARFRRRARRRVALLYRAGIPTIGREL